MADKSRIEWTEATWNPVTGCSKVSPGCAHCYAEALSLRYGWSKAPWTSANAEANVVLRPERLEQPRRWTRPRRIFVNSMSDLFHERVPDEFVGRVLNEMFLVSHHVYQVLTKRPERMAELVRRWYGRGGLEGYGNPSGLYGEPMPNVWLGTSIENDRWVGRADALRRTPAAVRFISAEPLLGPLPSLDLTGVGWLIVGGESGPGHRPMDLDWARDLRDRARAAGVPFFMKQVGGARPGGPVPADLDVKEYPAMRHPRDQEEER